MKRTNVLFCFFFATLSLSAQSKIIVGQEEAWGIVKQSVLGNKIEGTTTVLLVIGNILVDTFMLMQKTGNV